MAKSILRLFLCAVVMFETVSCSLTAHRQPASGIPDSATVSEWFDSLPPALRSRVGTFRVRRVFGGGGSGVSTLNGETFEVFVKPGASEEESRVAVARAVLEILYDRLAQPLMFGIPSLSHTALLKMPKDPLHSIPLRERMIAIGVNELTHRPYDDAYGKLWWKVRLFPDGFPKGVIKRSARLLGLVRTYGNYPDNGHSALAWVNLEGKPNLDLVFNPGAKNREDGWETTLPFFPKPGVLNEIKVRDLWDWAETQRHDRFLNVEFTFAAINPTQARALDRIAQGGDGLEWGAATMIMNNCAHGSRQLLNSLLGVENEITFFGILTPKLLLTRASDKFAIVTQERPSLTIDAETSPADQPKNYCPLVNTHHFAREKNESWLKFNAWREAFVNGLVD